MPPWAQRLAERGGKLHERVERKRRVGAEQSNVDVERTRRKIGCRAQCPDCDQVLNTLQLLTRHFARKHMSGERLHACYSHLQLWPRDA